MAPGSRVIDVGYPYVPRDDWFASDQNQLLRIDRFASRVRDQIEIDAEEEICFQQLLHAIQFDQTMENN
jgi:hypothetical protein